MTEELNSAVNNGEATGKDPLTGRFVMGNMLGRGNKGSRWLSKALDEAIMKVSVETGEEVYRAIIEKVIIKAKEGDMRAIALIWEKLEGKTPQTVDFKGQLSSAPPLSEEEKAKLLNLLR